ncbi:TetR/AcrR family transcriptional regulator [Cellulomonas denverensis]|uniref:TetR/AcrR family transcriptional regulator n=2 Tax=Cellulomonas denverensis TaxID=264297 RepID=A0A7X6QZR1_9CELL|nr:TetR/AcrR family transcriptional regulator [Cellulomonas denverensis]NKY23529.1 TetR/AcrR family transcriptional regulator [Cellulomonas denverensis]GIG24987.1 AcrR family transcriptional regulator [Cellulomonas denverensis]
MSVEDRRRQIAVKGAELVARYGSYGVSMQTVADAVGLTLPGLNHHVKSRADLLALIVETYYDDFSDEPTMLAHLRGLADPDDDGTLSLPTCLRRIVENNTQRPELVSLFMRLAVEAHDPAHPAHDYYAVRHARLLSLMASLPWRLPERFRDEHAFADLLRTAFCAMDGTEIQALTDPAESMADLWARVERTLFGAPEWDGCR